MTKANPKPGDILAYHRRPRHRGEILCHNRVMHISSMHYGTNGFRWFVCRAGSRDWEVCPCGWRPLGVHYAEPEHVRWTRKMKKKLRTQEAFDNYVAERVFPLFQQQSQSKRRG